MEIINHKGKYYLKTESGYREVLATTDTSLLIDTYINQGDTVKGDLIIKRGSDYTTGLKGRINLPQLTQQFIQKFIEEYNKGNVIKEVEVEHLLFLEPGNTLNDRKYDKIILKVNSDNTINIKPIKESWNREEVIELLHKSLDANIVFNDKFNKIFHEQLDEWIKVNL